MNSTSADDFNNSIRVTADNLMRRVLRIQDPSNPLEVAQGLGRAYPTESAELDEEIRGLPVAPTTPSSSYQVMGGASMTSLELAYAQDNIKRDLDYLVGSSQLKEVQVELQGWGETIRTWLADGAAASNQGLDPNARDRVFSARRIMLDYARVARLVGSMTPGLSIAYRRFARSLDEASGLLLVSLGETLAQVGFSGDRLLLQAPASELSARAELAVSALRNLIGPVTNGYASDWDWGTDAYRRLLGEIDRGGNSDIRVLLQENGLRAFTDELINRASSVNGDGLRTLAATHGVALNRVERLVLVAERFAKDAPPLSNFVNKLRLFMESFTGGSTTRLIAIGRPLISASWLYSFGNLDDGKTGTLITLIRSRAALAQLNDSMFGVQLLERDVRAQFQLDTCLYALDLAIDLYAVGMDASGHTSIEKRASGFGLLLWELFAQEGGIKALLDGSDNVVRSKAGDDLRNALDVIVKALSADTYQTDLAGLPPPLNLPQPAREALARELSQLDGGRPRLKALADAMSPGVFKASPVTRPERRALRAVYKVIGSNAHAGDHRIPPPLESSAAAGLGMLTHRLAPTTPTIDSVTFRQREIVIEGSGFIDVVAVLFAVGEERPYACTIGNHTSTHLEVALPQSVKKSGSYTITVATATGATTKTDTF